MRAQCKDNAGFEDQLTSSKSYRLLRAGSNSYLIENDKGQERWYGSQNFTLTSNF